MGIARLDVNVGLTALLAAFLDTGLVCSARAIQFLSNSFEKASSSHMCNNVHNAKWRVLPLLHRFNLFFVARKVRGGAERGRRGVRPCVRQSVHPTALTRRYNVKLNTRLAERARVFR